MMVSWRYTRRSTASGPRTRVKVRRLSDGREQVRKVGVRNYTDKGARHAGYKHTHRKGYYNATEGANQPSHRLKGYRRLRLKKGRTSSRSRSYPMGPLFRTWAKAPRILR